MDKVFVAFGTASGDNPLPSLARSNTVGEVAGFIESRGWTSNFNMRELSELKNFGLLYREEANGRVLVGCAAYTIEPLAVLKARVTVGGWSDPRNEWATKACMAANGCMDSIQRLQQVVTANTELNGLLRDIGAAGIEVVLQRIKDHDVRGIEVDRKMRVFERRYLQKAT